MNKIRPLKFKTPEQQIYELNMASNNYRGTLIEAHIADIHFGELNPKVQYDILKEQFINKLVNLDLDILSIDGDIFKHKYMSNADEVMYATMFVNDCVNLCRQKNATLIIIYGTKYHDADQLKLFYHYLNDSTVDVRIVEEVKFEYVKGAKILCIPELYNKGEDYYKKFLQSHVYDSVFMHGTIKGAIYQDKKEDTNSVKAPTFTIQDFDRCLGPIISGHVHVAGCFDRDFYYCGSPMRWRFGEEQEKGFLIVLHNLDTRQYHVHLEPIQSFKYDTINLDHMIMQDPKDIINHINKLREDGIDNIRVEFTLLPDDTQSAHLEILKSYYKTDKSVKIHIPNNKIEKVIKENKEILDEYKQYNYILDKSLTPYDILSRYINDQKGYVYISSEELEKLVKEDF